jgi:hypothetical protein
MDARHTLIATTIGLAVCGSAMAGAPSGDAASFTSERSRAEVKAEVLAARQAGTLLPAGEMLEIIAQRPNESMA